MPRGRKKIIAPVAERIEAVKTEIEKLSARLKEEQTMKKILATILTLTLLLMSCALAEQVPRHQLV